MDQITKLRSHVPNHYMEPTLLESDGKDLDAFFHSSKIYWLIEKVQNMYMGYTYFIKTEIISASLCKRRNAQLEILVHAQ